MQRRNYMGVGGKEAGGTACAHGCTLLRLRIPKKKQIDSPFTDMKF